MAAMSIFFIAIIVSNARFASRAPAASASVSAREVICVEETSPIGFSNCIGYAQPLVSQYDAGEA